MSEIGVTRVLKPRSVPEAVIHEMQRLYRLGKLKPGDRLPPEADFADQLGVGRSSVREAIRALQVMGLVEVRHGVGTFLTVEPGRLLLEPVKWVANSQERLFFDLIDARLCVEVTLARLATERLSEESLARIRERNERRRGAGPKNHVSKGFQFHLAIAEAADSPVLSFMMAAAANLYHEVLEQFERAEQGLQEEFFRRQQAGHDAILAAIERRDPPGAELAMREHLLESKRFYSLLTPTEDQ
jgi:GntR family transcriptional regulator, transcriptional repressor for pyruvate dehydrogenase complex